MKSALLLFSGGLDSILAVKILQKQNIKVTGLVFASYFFNAEQAKKSAHLISLPLIEKNFSQKHLKIVKNPLCGYGNGMNPCLDCHSLMLKEAWFIKEKNGFDTLATGEVLGQRPFSQNKQAFQRIEKLTGLKGKILRPLSAKLLEETDYEKTGMVEREKLEGIEGRSRKRQVQLAKKFKIKKYPSPAGGCCLTEKEFSAKLNKLLTNKIEPNRADFKLIKIGRHFWFDKTHIILGRNKEENNLIERIADESDLIIKPINFKGPTALLREKISEKIKKEAQGLIEKYSKKAPALAQYKTYFKNLL